MAKPGRIGDPYNYDRESFPSWRNLALGAIPIAAFIIVAVVVAEWLF